MLVFKISFYNSCIFFFKLTKFTNFALLVLFIALPQEPYYLDELTFDLNFTFPQYISCVKVCIRSKISPVKFYGPGPAFL